MHLGESGVVGLVPREGEVFRLKGLQNEPREGLRESNSELKDLRTPHCHSMSAAVMRQCNPSIWSPIVETRSQGSAGEQQVNVDKR
jgi:hypothetical protein